MKSEHHNPFLLSLTETLVYLNNLEAQTWSLAHLQWKILEQ